VGLLIGPMLSGQTPLEEEVERLRKEKRVGGADADNQADANAPAPVLDRLVECPLAHTDVSQHAAADADGF